MVDVTGDSCQAVRGGSWDNNRNNAHCACRNKNKTMRPYKDGFLTHDMEMLGAFTFTCAADRLDEFEFTVTSMGNMPYIAS